MMRRNRVELFSIALLPLGVGLAAHGSGEVMASESVTVTVEVAGPVSYAEQVAPILIEHCADCHGEETQESGLDLTSYEAVMTGSEYGPVIEAGDPDTSLLIEMIVAGEMPQDADPVPEDEIEVLRQWIAAGAENN